MSSGRERSEAGAIVTGAAGFLGSHLVRRLAEAGGHVLATDLRVPPRELGAKSGGRVKFMPLDILWRDNLDGTLEAFVARQEGPIRLFHMAGWAHVGQCQAEPARAYEVNVTGTLNVLESCRRIGISRIVFPSTTLVYGHPAELPMDETAPTRPLSIYAATKLASESLLQGYAAAFGFSCAIARIANVFGYGASSDAVPMILLRQALNREALRVRTLTPTRDFIYRDDVVEGLAALGHLEDPPGCRVYNLGTGQAHSIRDLALAVCRIAGLPEEVAALEPDRPESTPDLVLSSEALFRRSGWRPKWSLEDGLRVTLRAMVESER